MILSVGAIISGALILETTFNSNVRNQVNAIIVDSINFIRAGVLSSAFQVVQLGFFVNNLIIDPYTTFSLFKEGLYTTLPDVGFSMFVIPLPVIACSIYYDIPRTISGVIGSTNVVYAKAQENAVLHTMVYNAVVQMVPRLGSKESKYTEYTDITTRLITNLALMAIKDNEGTPIKVVITEIFSWQIRWLSFATLSKFYQKAAVFSSIIAKTSKKFILRDHDDIIAIVVPVLSGEFTKTLFVESEKMLGAYFGGFFKGSQFLVSSLFYPLERLKVDVLENYNQFVSYLYNTIVHAHSLQSFIHISNLHKINEKPDKADCNGMPLIETNNGIVTDNISDKRELAWMEDPNAKGALPCDYKALEFIDSNDSWRNEKLTLLAEEHEMYVGLAKMHGLLPNTPCFPPLEI